MSVGPDAELRTFWDSYSDLGRPGARLLLRRPGAVLRAARAIRSLRVVRVSPSTSAEGRAVDRVLRRPGPLGLPSRVFGSAALQVPGSAEDYLRGRRAQTLRRKVRAAERAGLRVEPVTDVAERAALVELADEQEQQHPQPVYRVLHPDNDDLVGIDLWLVVRDAEDEPLLLSVTPVDGEVAVLRYFRTLGSGPAHSDARYLATAALVGVLAERGARWLVDTEPVGAQTNGLRHFQRMLGFEYVRFRLRRAGSRGA